MAVSFVILDDLAVCLDEIESVSGGLREGEPTLIYLKHQDKPLKTKSSYDTVMARLKTAVSNTRPPRNDFRENYEQV